MKKHGTQLLVVIRQADDPIFKIGMSKDGESCWTRLVQLQGGNPDVLTFEAIYFVKNAYDVEQELHEYFWIVGSEMNGSN